MRYFLSLVVVIFLAAHSLPYLIKDQALIWLKKQGVAAPTFKAIEIEWFSGAVVLKKLTAQMQQAQPLHLESLRLQIDYPALFKKHILIKELTVSGFSSGIEQRDDGLFIGPINLNQFDSSKKEEEAPTSPSQWTVGIQNVNISELDFAVNVPPYKQKLSITNASLTDLYQWDAQKKTNLLVKGFINQSAFDINTVATPLSVNKSSQLKLNLTRFPLDSVAAAVMPGLSGFLDADLSLNVDFKNLTGKLTHQGSFNLSSIKLLNKQQNISFDRLNWQGKGSVSIIKAKIAQADLEGKLQLTKLALAQKKKQTLSLGALNWHGPLSTRFVEGQIKHLSIADNLSLDALDVNQAGMKITIQQLISQAKKSSLLVNFANNVLQDVTLTNPLSIKQFSFQAGPQKIALKKLSVSHPQPLVLTFKKGAPNALAGAPTIAVSGLNIAQPKLSVSAQAFSTSGSIKLNSLIKSPTISAQNTSKATALKLKISNQFSLTSAAIKLSAGVKDMPINKPNISVSQLSVSKFSLNSLTQSLRIAAFDQLAVKKASYSLNNTAVAQISIKNLSVAQSNKKQTLTKIEQLKINTLKLKNNNQLSIAGVYLVNSTSQLNIASSGKIPLLDQLTKALTGDTKSSKKAAGKNTSKSAFNYNIAQLKVSGHNRLSIEDKSVDPWFSSKLDLNLLDIKNINNKSQKSFPIALKAKINDNATLALAGSFAPFARAKNGQWNLTLKNLSMPVISPYAGKFSGYFLDSGKISIKSSGTIKKNMIKGKNKINIAQLAVRSADSDATSKTNSSLNMPLDMAISILENDKGNIALSVPVTGSTDDPNFGYSSIVEIIAKKGLKKAAFGILTKALQPYGALITLASTAIDAKNSGTFINLAPVSFPAGQATIDKKMRGYLKKIASMMIKRKKLKLKICATGVSADKAILSPDIIKQNAKLKKPLAQKALNKTIKNNVQALATLRGKNVQKELRRLRVKNDRLFVCFAKINFKKSKLKPSVSLGL